MTTRLDEEYPKLDADRTKIRRVMFNLETDPGERKNVLDVHLDVATRMQPLIESTREDLGDSARQMPANTPHRLPRRDHPANNQRYPPQEQ